MPSKLKPTFQRIEEIGFDFVGEIGARLKAVIDQWILPAPVSNPAMLEMFRDRDRKPFRNMVPWAGEFAGKYLTHAVGVYRLTSDPQLEKHLTWFVDELVSLQADDGYLGPWPRKSRFTGTAPNSYNLGQKLPTWDAWGHYHIVLGLSYWHDMTGSRKAIRCACKIADMVCRKYLKSRKRLWISTTEPGENLTSLLHGFCLLYEQTGNSQYLKMARKIEKDFQIPPGGDYVRASLAGLEFYEMPAPRWESLHSIQGIADLFILDARNINAKNVTVKSWIKPWMLWEFTAIDRKRIRLCDFASAGVTGNRYQTWLKVTHVPSTAFSRINPLRSWHNK